MVSSTLCPLCYTEIELLNHCLVNGPLVKSVWVKVGSWWGVDLSGFSLDDFIYGSRITFANKWAAKAFCGVTWSLVWYILKWRNEVVHASLNDLPSILSKDLFPDLQRMSRLWVSNRCSKIGVDWSMWMSSPNLCFSSIGNQYSSSVLVLMIYRSLYLTLLFFSSFVSCWFSLCFRIFAVSKKVRQTQ